MSMDDQQLNEWIIDQLSGGRDPDDLIPAVCEVTGKSWKEASALVYATQDHRGDEILRRQSPLLTMVAFFTFLSGVAFLGYAAFILLNLLGWVPSEWVVEDESANIPRNFFSMIVMGAGMVMGSLLGLRDVWAAFLFPNRPTD